MLSRKYLLTSYIFEPHPNSTSLPYSLGPLIVIVSLLSFSLLMDRITVPDVKLRKGFFSFKPGDNDSSMNQAGQPAWHEIPGENTDNFTHLKCRT